MLLDFGHLVDEDRVRDKVLGDHRHVTLRVVVLLVALHYNVGDLVLVALQELHVLNLRLELVHFDRLRLLIADVFSYQYFSDWLLRQRPVRFKVVAAVEHSLELDLGSVDPPHDVVLVSFQLRRLVVVLGLLAAVLLNLKLLLVDLHNFVMFVPHDFVVRVSEDRLQLVLAECRHACFGAG